MFGGKQYGEAKIAVCTFCGGNAYSKNAQGVPTCQNHTTQTLPDVKCMCGAWLDLREGKWGPFYLCEKCGPVNLQKAMIMHKEGQTGNGTWKVQGKQGPTAAKSPTTTSAAVSKEASAAVAAVRAEAQRVQRSRINAYTDEYGREKYIRSDDPRFEFK